MGKNLNKKGSVQDIFFVIVILFIMAIIPLFLHFTINEIFTDFHNELNKSNLSTVEIDKTFERTRSVNDMFDYIFLFLSFGLIVAIIITSYLVNVHPVFFPIFVILLALAVVISVALSNAYMEIEQVAALNSTMTKFRITSNIMENLPILTTLIGAIALVVLYSKTRGGVAVE